MIFSKKHKPEDIASAHEKQRRWAIGHGGIVFTPAEKAVLDEGVPLYDEDEEC